MKPLWQCLLLGLHCCHTGDYLAAVEIVVHACVLLFKFKGHTVGWQCVTKNKGIARMCASMYLYLSELLCVMGI